MRILFISNYFPPEVNAPATRLYEHACHWVRDGHEVEVLTSVPNFPEGKVYDGYRNRFTREDIDGIKVTRVPMFVSPNEGILRRALSYLSFMVSARWYVRRLQQEPDVVVATSPQIFAAVVGYLVARFEQVPFVLEIRDLWPESIVAVGAMQRNGVIRLFERLELFLYEHADHIVVLTEAFREFIERKNIEAGKISVLMNGAELSAYEKTLDADRLRELRRRYALEGKFVASYIGTVGMAHRADVMLEAARRCTDPNVVFMVVGTGAERDKLTAMQEALRLPNVRLIDKQPKDVIPYFLALTDVSVVHLKATPLFRTVIPSKIFEAMATRTPIVLGLEGESRRLVERAEAGIAFPPEDAGALMEAVLRLRDDPTLYVHMANRGYEYVHDRHDRHVLARRYATLLHRVVWGIPMPEPAVVPELEPREDRQPAPSVVSPSVGSTA